MPERHSGDGARAAREAHNLEIAGLDSRSRNQTYSPEEVALLARCVAASSGVIGGREGRTMPPLPASSPAPLSDPRRQSVPDPFAEELEASRQNRQSAPLPDSLDAMRYAFTDELEPTA